MSLLKKIFLLGLAIFLTTGCSLTKDSLEDAQIYTTVYPIEYLAKFLYSDYSNVESIYPNGADISNKKLTEKKIKKYAKGDLFIYNGLSNEKTITKDLINKNDNLLIIDVSNGLNYTYDIEELWMSPNNYLMLAKNIKDYLIEYLSSKSIINYVEQKYDELSEILSLKDADLRAIGKEAKEKGKNTLIVNDDVFKFLEKHGHIDHREMFNIYNMGIGMVLAVDSKDVEEVISILHCHGEKAYNIGVITNSGIVDIK